MTWNRSSGAEVTFSRPPRFRHQDQGRQHGQRDNRDVDEEDRVPGEAVDQHRRARRYRRPPGRSVFSGEPLPCCLFGHAERPSDTGPADASGAQDAHMIVYGGVGLGHHSLGPRQARKELVVWLLGPRAKPRHRILGDDLTAQSHAFVADVDTPGRPRAWPLRLCPCGRTSSTKSRAGWHLALDSQNSSCRQGNLDDWLRQGELDGRPAARRPPEGGFRGFTVRAASGAAGPGRISAAAAPAASAAACRKLRMASRCAAGTSQAIALIRVW